MHVALRSRRRRRPAERRRVVAEEHGNAVETGPDPDDLAARAELVELRRLVPGHTARQHVRLPERHRQREPLKRDERLAQRRTAVDPLPARQEPCECGLLGRLDLAPQGGERGAPQAPQDVRIAPFALDPAGPELAANEQLVVLERV